MTDSGTTVEFVTFNANDTTNTNNIVDLSVLGAILDGNNESFSYVDGNVTITDDEEGSNGVVNGNSTTTTLDYNEDGTVESQEVVVDAPYLISNTTTQYSYTDGEAAVGTQVADNYFGETGSTTFDYAPNGNITEEKETTYSQSNEEATGYTDIGYTYNPDESVASSGTVDENAAGTDDGGSGNVYNDPASTAYTENGPIAESYTTAYYSNGEPYSQSDTGYGSGGSTYDAGYESWSYNGTTTASGCNTIPTARTPTRTA